MHNTPLYTINGPLGAGKTTLLKHLLTLPGFAHARLIENEFASISVDSAQLHAHDNPIVTIAGECICCSTGDELVDALTTFATSPEPVIIEATGMADSLQLFEKLAGKGVFDLYDLRCNFFVYDGVELASTPSLPWQTTAELRAADVVLVTKCDLLTPSQLPVVQRLLVGSTIDNVRYVSNGKMSLGTIPATSRMTEYYLTHESGEHTLHSSMAYTVIDMNHVTFDSNTIKETLLALASSHGLRRAKGDFFDIHGQPHHLEMTPSQCRVERTDSISTGLVLIGSDVQRITASELGGSHAS